MPYTKFFVRVSLTKESGFPLIAEVLPMSYKGAVKEGDEQMETQTNESTNHGTGMVVVWLVLLAIAGVVATVLWMLRA